MQYRIKKEFVVLQRLFSHGGNMSLLATQERVSRKIGWPEDISFAGIAERYSQSKELLHLQILRYSFEDGVVQKTDAPICVIFSVRDRCLENVAYDKHNFAFKRRKCFAGKPVALITLDINHVLVIVWEEKERMPTLVESEFFQKILC